MFLLLLCNDMTGERASDLQPGPYVAVSSSIFLKQRYCFLFNHYWGFLSPQRGRNRAALLVVEVPVPWLISPVSSSTNAGYSAHPQLGLARFGVAHSASARLLRLPSPSCSLLMKKLPLMLGTRRPLRR